MWIAVKRYSFAYAWQPLAPFHLFLRKSSDLGKPSVVTVEIIRFAFASCRDYGFLDAGGYAFVSCRRLERVVTSLVVFFDFLFRSLWPCRSIDPS